MECRFKNPRSGLTFIEQLQIACDFPCEKINRPYLVGTHIESKTVILSRPNCKMWDCPVCAAKNAKKWIAKIINGCNRIGGEWSFATITASRYHRKVKSVANIRQGWKKLYNRILEKCNQQGLTLYYAKVWEQHEDGTYHLHALFSVNFGTRWLKDNAAQCGLGYQADWQAIDNAGQIAGYIAKYTLKNASVARGGIEWEKGLRRIETSRNFPKLPDNRADSVFKWVVNQTREGQVRTAQQYFDRGFDIIDTVKT